MPDNLRDKAKRYSNFKYCLAIIEIFYTLMLLFIFQAAGFSTYLARWLEKTFLNNFLVLSGYIFLFYLIYYILNFPLNFYQSFILERKFCLSSQKAKDWFIDQIKSGIISYIVLLILTQAFYFILERFSHAWWVVVSLFWVFFSLILAKLTPIIIIPLFFKYKKFTDEKLKERILNLARKMRITVLDCFEIDFSKKTLKANAGFVGLGKSRRVILADTLKDRYSHDEIEVILAHEFAHYKLRHLLKLIFINSLVTVLCFYLIFKTSDYILNIFNLASLSDMAALPVLIIYFILSSIFMQPLNNYLSRKMEANADKMALDITGLKEAFISMMDKLAAQNLADRTPRPFIKFFFFDHPPIDERINSAQSL